MAKLISEKELLFHPVHGLCRVLEVHHKANPEESSCFLSPIPQSRSRSRFTVPLKLLESSGFNRMVSAKEALHILNYFKTGEKKKSAKGHAWTLAEALRNEACSKEVSKDKRKIQQINQMAKSMVCELAIVLQLTTSETLLKVQENLEPLSKVNPLVLTALANADTI